MIGLLSQFEQGMCKSMGAFTLYAVPYTLSLKNVFTVTSGSRSTSPVVLVALCFEGEIGYGEASMPFYLGESHDSVLSFLNKVDLSSFVDPFCTADLLEHVDAVAPGNTAAKAAIDIALHDLIGKLLGKPLHALWGLNPQKAPLTTFTLGMDQPEVLKKKTQEASAYPLLKIKLGLGEDKETIQAIRRVTDKPLCVDVNQGWKEKEEALDMAYWLAEQQVLFIEQPLNKLDKKGNAWLTARSPLPTFGDEAVQRIEDVVHASGIYSGVNIKLMKCTGLREAHTMLILAKALGLQTLLGCMTETSCAISAAAQLSPLADWADLDGNLLISNDPFKGVQVEEGLLKLNSLPGIGLQNS